MSEPFIGEIRPFAFPFYPGDDYWLPCNGQTVAVAQYQALFSIIGTIYGPQPTQQTFVLPNLNGAAGQVGLPMLGKGAGPGLSNYNLAQKTGVQTVQLSPTQMPPHNHTITAINAPASGTYSAPTAASHLSRSFVGSGVANAYSDKTPTVTMGASTLSVAGSGQVHNNMQPYLGVLYAIAVNGVYPVPA
jgi:microcystin-dependent protein